MIDVTDIEEADYLSLEQVIVKAEEDRIMSKTKEEKEKTLAILKELTEEYNSILIRYVIYVMLELIFRMFCSSSVIKISEIMNCHLLRGSPMKS